MFKKLKTMLYLRRFKKFLKRDTAYYMAFVDLIEQAKKNYYEKSGRQANILIINPKYLKCLLPHCKEKIKRVAGLSVFYSNSLKTFMLATGYDFGLNLDYRDITEKERFDNEYLFKS